MPSIHDHRIERLTRLSFLLAAVMAAGCGGGNAADATVSDVFATSPTNASQPAPAPPPAGAAVYYFSDCQIGAAAGCVPGNNANAGTQASPKRDLSGTNVNALPAGSQLLFARGGAWNWATLDLENLNVTPTSPLVLDAYGTGAAPLLRTASNNAFEIGGNWGNTSNDGGYTIRNVRLDGRGTAQWGVWLVQNVRSVTLDNVDISGFLIGVHSSVGSPHGVTGLVVRNSRINGQREHGILGSANDLLLEGNRFENNNPDGGNREHGVYLGGNGRNGVVRNNVFTNNSAPGGVCDGGNLTVHGQWDGLLIEGNTISQVASTGGCYGMQINSGYDSPEYFRNVVVRGNTIINVGNCGVCAAAAPGIVVEGNRVFNNQPTYQVGVLIPDRVIKPTDDADRNAIVRNNTVCLVNPSSGSAAVRSTAPGATETGTVYQTGAAATTGACAQ